MEVAHAAALAAFGVKARDGWLHTHHACFVLHQQARRSALTVVSGEVQLVAAGRTARVGANQQLIYSSDVMGWPEPVDAAGLSAWTRGKLIFNQQPLQGIVAELGRHLPARTFVVGDRLQRLRLSGVLGLDDVQAALRSVASLAGAELLHLPLLWVLR